MSALSLQIEYFSVTFSIQNYNDKGHVQKSFLDSKSALEREGNKLYHQKQWIFPMYFSTLRYRAVA